MTNYNERLDRAIINELFGGKIPLDEPEQRELAFRIPQFKQALTSLIKELVAEAKPKTMPSNLSPENYERCERVVNQYHQNLLKALEVDNER